MNNVERVFSESGSCAEYARGYLGYLAGLLSRVDIEAVARFAGLLEEARAGGRQVFFMGNGGSAATSSHFANDLGKGARAAGAGAAPKGRAPAVSATAAVALVRMPRRRRVSRMTYSSCS